MTVPDSIKFDNCQTTHWVTDRCRVNTNEFTVIPLVLHVRRA